MAQQLIVHTDLASTRVQFLAPMAGRKFRTARNSSSVGIQRPLLASVGICTHTHILTSTHTDTQLKIRLGVVMHTCNPSDPLGGWGRIVACGFRASLLGFQVTLCACGHCEILSQ